MYIQASYIVVILHLLLFSKFLWDQHCEKAEEEPNALLTRERELYEKGNEEFGNKVNVCLFFNTSSKDDSGKL